MNWHCWPVKKPRRGSQIGPTVPKVRCFYDRILCLCFWTKSTWDFERLATGFRPIDGETSIYLKNRHRQVYKCTGGGRVGVTAILFRGELLLLPQPSRHLCQISITGKYGHFKRSKTDNYHHWTQDPCICKMVSTMLPTWDFSNCYTTRWLFYIYYKDRMQLAVHIFVNIHR